MSRIIVTGGAGFIGSHIVDIFVAGKHEVAVIDNLTSGMRSNIPSNVEFRQLDVRSASAREFVAKWSPDLIVHAAAQISVRLSMEDPVFDTEVNVIGLVNILHAFRGRDLPYIVFVSTGGAIYGDQELFPAPESHKVRPASVYGLAKHVSELYLDLWKRVYGLRYVSLRLANVYGPRQNPHGEAGVVAIFSRKLLMGEVPVINGTGEQTRDYIYVADVAAAVDRACQRRVCGTYNIGTGVETPVNKLYRMICKAVGSDREAHHGPAKAGEQSRSSIDSNAALSDLGWKPEWKIEDGVKTTVEWFKEN